MVTALEQGGKDGEQWQGTMATMNDLLWSIRPKQGAIERQRLVKLLPGLLRSLRTGFDTIAASSEARDEFFAELVKLHAMAVKSGMSSPSPSAHPPPDGVLVNTDTEASIHSPAEINIPTSPAELNELERGSWIELHIEDAGTRAVRLTWISPARTMYLFANRQGQRALALTRAELTRKLVSGEAQLLDDEPYMDKIVAEVLDEYQQPGI